MSYSSDVAGEPELLAAATCSKTALELQYVVHTLDEEKLSGACL